MVAARWSGACLASERVPYPERTVSAIMLNWLLQTISGPWQNIEWAPVEETRVFITARLALASLTAFCVAVACGPLGIAWLKARFRERIASGSERLNELHAGKRDTPTMGGILILATALVAILLWGNLANRYVQLACLLLVGFGTLGAVDDWVKLRTSRNGLSARQKFAWQLALSFLLAVGLFWLHEPTPDGLKLFFPIGRLSISMGHLFIIWSMLVLVASSNGVNLTDGLDGLAGGCMIFAGVAFVTLTYLCGHRGLAEYLHIPHLVGAGELAVVLAAIVGGVLGFLWFNCFPAQVFMGDTGSLPLGALLGFAALVTRQEALLIVIGGVFVAETASVILQVAWFKRTGRRLLACSPLHNHFLFRGWHEVKIVVRFWIIAALLALAGVASLQVWR